MRGPHRATTKRKHYSAPPLKLKLICLFPSRHPSSALMPAGHLDPSREEPEENQSVGCGAWSTFGPDNRGFNFPFPAWAKPTATHQLPCLGSRAYRRGIS